MLLNKQFEGILKMMLDRKASDLHIVANHPLYFRIDGNLASLPDSGYTQEDLEAIIRSVMSEDTLDRYMKSGDAEFSISLPSSHERFRVSVYKERGNHCLSIRHIPSAIPSFAQLGLPQDVTNDLSHKDGLILVTGPAGNGKSTSLAAMIHWLNAHKRLRIITIEDPIEYYHVSERSLISQREVGHDTESFNTALKQALRQDPDVLVVGEMRDLETIRLALIAAETGHLVLATLHSADSIQAISRIIDVFLPEFQDQVRVQLAGCLRAIYAQRLLPTASGVGRVLALEILRNSTALASLIRNRQEQQIRNYIAMNISSGMTTMDRSIKNLPC